jgi:hypothetical protein
VIEDFTGIEDLMGKDSFDVQRHLESASEFVNDHHPLLRCESGLEGRLDTVSGKLVNNN